MASLTVLAACVRVQELCESRGGRPGLSVSNSAYCLCGREVTFEEGDEEAFFLLLLLLHGALRQQKNRMAYQGRDEAARKCCIVNYCVVPVSYSGSPIVIW